MNWTRVCDNRLDERASDHGQAALMLLRARDEIRRDDAAAAAGVYCVAQHAAAEDRQTGRDQYHNAQHRADIHRHFSEQFHIRTRLCWTSLQSDRNLRGPRIACSGGRCASPAAARTALLLPRALPRGQTDGRTDRRTRRRFNTLTA